MLHFKNLARTICFTLLIVSCSPEKNNNETEQPLSISAAIIGWQLLPFSRNTSVEVTLTNNTTDTLRYVSMSCSWQDAYTVDVKELRVRGTACDKNIPEIIAIPPHEKERRTVILDAENDSEKLSKLKFRIGFNLLTANTYKGAIDKLEQLQTMRNVVWSNTLELQ